MQAQTGLQVYSEVVNNMQYGIAVWRLEHPDDPSSLTAVTSNPAANRISGVDMRPPFDYENRRPGTTLDTAP
jgi:hypothetical protein